MDGVNIKCPVKKKFLIKNIGWIAGNLTKYYLTRKVDKVNEYLKAISSQAEDTSSEGSTTTWAVKSA